MKPRNVWSACIVVLSCLTTVVTAVAADPAAAVSPYILPNAVGVVVLRPRQMFLRTENKGESVAILAARFRRENGLVRPLDLLLRTAQHFDLPLQEIEEASYVVQELKLPERLPIRGWPVLDAWVIRASRPLDPTAASQLLFRARPQQLGGKLYWGQGKDDLICACALLDDRTLLIGPETIVRRVLANPSGEGAIAKAAGAFRAQDDLSIAFDPAALRGHPLLGDEGLASEITKRASLVGFNLTFGPQLSAALRIDCSTPETATTLHNILTNTLAVSAQGLEAAAAQAREGQAPPAVKAAGRSFFDLLQQAVKARKGGVEGTRIAWEIPATAVLKLTQDYTATFAFTERIIDAQGVVTEIFRTSWFDAAAEKKAMAQHGPVAENDVAAAVRRAFPAAAAMSIDDLAALASSPRAPRVEDIPDQTLSLFWLTERVPDLSLQAALPERVKEFNTGGVHLSPARMAEHMSLSAPLGFCTLVQWEDIMHVSARVEGDAARGVIEFDVPRLVTGKVHYEARRKEGLWELVKFELPAHQMRCLRSAAGTWELHHGFGRVGSKLPTSQVEGTIRVDGQPLAGARVEFLHNPHLWDFSTRTGIGGKFSLELPPGRYFVAVKGDKLPKKYLDAGTSGLVVEVTKEPAPIELELRSN